jgi:hypothetical protein
MVKLQTYTTSMFIQGNDVYVAGNEYNGSIYTPKYWKNGKETILSDGKRYSEAQAIAVFGTDIFIAGYESNDKSIHVAKYWKNGVATTLSDGSKYASAKSIFVR